MHTHTHTHTHTHRNIHSGMLSDKLIITLHSHNNNLHNSHYSEVLLYVVSLMQPVEIEEITITRKRPVNTRDETSRHLVTANHTSPSGGM